MTKTINLSAQKRIKTEKLNALRKSGYVPAVIYGQGTSPKSVKVKRMEMEKAYKEAGEGTLINFSIEGDTTSKVLIKDVQKNILKNTLEHIDFYQVDMNKEISAEIHLDFVGVSKAEKELGGVLVKNLHSVEIQCLPEDLVNFIEVDLSKIATMEDEIKISDLPVPNGVKILADADTIVVGVVAVSVEKEPEVKPAEEAPKAENAKAAPEAAKAKAPEKK